MFALFSVQTKTLTTIKERTAMLPFKQTNQLSEFAMQDNFWINH